MVLPLPRAAVISTGLRVRPPIPSVDSVADATGVRAVVVVVGRRQPTRHQSTGAAPRSRWRGGEP